MSGSTPLAAELRHALTRAALDSGWPTFRLSCEGEEALFESLGLLEATLGALPQADELEPFEEAQAWELRVDMPWLTEAQWNAALAALPDATLEPGEWPGVREALDTQALLEDVLEAAELVAVQRVLVEGGVRPPDWTREDDTDGALVAALAESLRALDPGLMPEGGLQAVRDRTTGRRAWLLALPSAPFETLGGDALLQLRSDALMAVGRVIAARAHDALYLSPDVQFDTRLGLTLVLWRGGSPGPTLPVDDVVAPGLSPTRGALMGWVAAASESKDALELQVLPTSLEQHDVVIGGVLDALEGVEGLDIVGSRPRWLAAATPNGPRPCFAPTWSVVGADGDPLADLAERLVRLDGVHGVRVVPGCPAGLEGAWPYVDPAWTAVGERVLVRLRDGHISADRLMPLLDRPASGEDERTIEALVSTGRRWGVEVEARAVVDGRGGLGLCAELPEFLELGARGLPLLLELVAVPNSRAAPIVQWSAGSTRTTMHWCMGSAT